MEIIIIKDIDMKKLLFYLLFLINLIILFIIGAASDLTLNLIR